MQIPHPIVIMTPEEPFLIEQNDNKIAEEHDGFERWRWRSKVARALLCHLRR